MVRRIAFKGAEYLRELGNAGKGSLLYTAAGNVRTGEAITLEGLVANTISEFIGDKFGGATTAKMAEHSFAKSLVEGIISNVGDGTTGSWADVVKEFKEKKLSYSTLDLLGRMVEKGAWSSCVPPGSTVGHTLGKAQRNNEATAAKREQLITTRANLEGPQLTEAQQRAKTEAGFSGVELARALQPQTVNSSEGNGQVRDNDQSLPRDAIVQENPDDNTNNNQLAINDRPSNDRPVDQLNRSEQERQSDDKPLAPDSQRFYYVQQPSEADIREQPLDNQEREDLTQLQVDAKAGKETPETAAQREKLERRLAVTNLNKNEKARLEQLKEKIENKDNLSPEKILEARALANRENASQSAIILFDESTLHLAKKAAGEDGKVIAVDINKRDLRRNKVVQEAGLAYLDSPHLIRNSQLNLNNQINNRTNQTNQLASQQSTPANNTISGARINTAQSGNIALSTSTKDRRQADNSKVESSSNNPALSDSAKDSTGKDNSLLADVLDESTNSDEINAVSDSTELSTEFNQDEFDELVEIGDFAKAEEYAQNRLPDVIDANSTDREITASTLAAMGIAQYMQGGENKLKQAQRALETSLQLSNPQGRNLSQEEQQRREYLIATRLALHEFSPEETEAIIAGWIEGKLAFNALAEHRAKNSTQNNTHTIAPEVAGSDVAEEYLPSINIASAENTRNNNSNSIPLTNSIVYANPSQNSDTSSNSTSFLPNIQIANPEVDLDFSPSEIARNTTNNGKEFDGRTTAQSPNNLARENNQLAENDVDAHQLQQQYLLLRDEASTLQNVSDNIERGNRKRALRLLISSQIWANTLRARLALMNIQLVEEIEKRHAANKAKTKQLLISSAQRRNQSTLERQIDRDFYWQLNNLLDLALAQSINEQEILYGQLKERGIEIPNPPVSQLPSMNAGQQQGTTNNTNIAHNSTGNTANNITSVSLSDEEPNTISPSFSNLNTDLLSPVNFMAEQQQFVGPLPKDDLPRIDGTQSKAVERSIERLWMLPEANQIDTPEVSRWVSHIVDELMPLAHELLLPENVAAIREPMDLAEQINIQTKHLHELLAKSEISNPDIDEELEALALEMTGEIPDAAKNLLELKQKWLDSCNRNEAQRLMLGQKVAETLNRIGNAKGMPMVQVEISNSFSNSATADQLYGIPLINMYRNCFNSLSEDAEYNLIRTLMEELGHWHTTPYFCGISNSYFNRYVE